MVDTWPVQALPESAGAPFTKLPEPGRGGLILASLDILGKPLGMAWNRKAGRVWLDLNGNRDFSDDPEGVFQTPERGPAQTFTNTHLTAVTRRGPRAGVPGLGAGGKRPVQLCGGGAVAVLSARKTGGGWRGVAGGLRDAVLEL